MSRRHHHHMQPYDYERFTDHSRDRERDQARGIEYQDDSLSSINSDEESYLHHPHTSKDKKPNFYVKAEPSHKPHKAEKSSNNELYHPKEIKVQEVQSHASGSSDATAERLSRLESMLEELVKRSTAPPPEIPPVSKVSEKGSSERRSGQFCLEPRRHDFTTSMWINKIQEVSIQNNWNEKSTIQYMASQMSGIVKAWYNSLPNYDYTWPEWKILISKVFPDNSDFVTTLKRLVTRLKQGEESITTYYFSKMYLIDACKITGEDAVSCLIDGLNNQSIQEQAKLHNFLTPETLYSQFLMLLPEYTVDYAPSIAPTTDSVLNHWYYQDQEQEEANVEETEEAEIAIPEEQLFEYEKDTRIEEFEYRNQGKQAFHMNDDVSHSVKSPQKRQIPVHSRLDKRFIRPNNFRYQNKVPMAAKVCSICLSRGHLARNCRKADKMLFCKLLSNKPNRCFYKDCKINQHRLDAFVDTGCTTVTIKEKAARDLSLVVNPTSDLIEIYGGGLIQTLGKTEIDIEMDLAKGRVSAVVVPDHLQDVSVIVGQEFLNQKDVCVFLHNETLKIFEAPFKLTD